jgi:hypothetical protein
MICVGVENALLGQFNLLGREGDSGGGFGEGVFAVVDAEAGAGDLQEVPAGAWFWGKGWAFGGCGFLRGVGE